ncbi:MAG TPA: ABC transporter permease subunit [Candidatus Limnocylindria bacterium]|nr:ABC transporter permease subunit [Candidatus Limnocylindria bacterium]
MNSAVFRHALRQNRLRLLAVLVALVGWGALMPVIYATFGVEMQEIVRQFPMMDQFTRFGGGNMFTLPGSVGLGFIHPIAIALLAVFAIAYPVMAVAGERQRGTLENVLARPVSRRSLYVTLLVTATLFIALCMAAALIGALLASAAVGRLDELQMQNLPLLWLNGTLLYLAFASIGLAASVSFDRAAPAAAITLAIVLVAYFLQVLGSLWPDAEWLQPYSLFYYLKAEEVLVNGLPLVDVALLAAVAALGVVYALVVFPRRDVAAPA